MTGLRLIAFDLDGTLIDSEEDLAGSVNAMLGHYGRAALPRAVIRSYIGDGASMLVRRALGDPEGGAHPEALVHEATELFLRHYSEHKLDRTRLYPEVREALETIQAEHAGAMLAVLTNKPVSPSREICEGLGIAAFFAEIVGGDSFARKKPDPVGLVHLLEVAGGGRPVRGDEAVLVGDSLVDLATAEAAGVWSIGCTFGLVAAETVQAAGPTRVAHSAREWPALCRELAGLVGV